MRGRIKRIYRLARAFFPSRLPVTDAEHYEWATRLLELSRLPDNSSFRHKLGTIILHLDDSVYRKSDNSFIAELNNAIAKQAAYNQIDKINKAEKAIKEVVVEGQVVS